MLIEMQNDQRVYRPFTSQYIKPLSLEQQGTLLHAREAQEQRLLNMVLDIYGDDYELCVREIQVACSHGSWRDDQSLVSEYSMRRRLTDIFSWAIPSQEALEAIAECGPIIEIGAGTGYWAHLLRSRYHVNILAYDKYPLSRTHNHFHRQAKPWTGVLYGRPVKAKKHPDRALMLSWPPYYSDMAYDAIRHYDGNTVIYIGEGWGGCTGTHEFHELLQKEFELKREVKLPQWDGVHDFLEIYTRKGGA